MEAVRKRYPPVEHVIIEEAPQNSDRSGRRLDALVVSTWRSRGLAIDGIEVKVSVSDFRRELKEPDKADWWYRRCNRFWIAAPADVAKKIRPELPTTWGLLSCGETARVSVQAPTQRAVEPLDWPVVVGLLRALDGASMGSIQREYQRGYAEGLKVGREASPVEVDDAELRRLRRVEADANLHRETVAAFEAASGLRIGSFPREAERLGHIVAAVRAGIIQGPDVLSTRLAHQAEQMRSIAETTDKLRAALVDALRADADTPPLDLFGGAA